MQVKTLYCLHAQGLTKGDEQPTYTPVRFTFTVAYLSCIVTIAGELSTQNRLCLKSSLL